jgi:DnaK suppressor protein
MEQVELKQFKGIVERLLAGLERPLHRREAIAVESSADAFDQIENASGRDLAARQLELQSSRLRGLRSALRRIEDGTYGICLECGSNIGTKRLQAIPWTRHCISCQELADHDGSRADCYWGPAAASFRR